MARESRPIALEVIDTWLRGDIWVCHVDDVSPGATIARTRGATRDEAIAAALERARPRLARTRRFAF